MQDKGRRSAAHWRNGAERYGSPSIALHWLMLLLIAAVYASIELRELFPKGSDPREALKTWHSMLGLCVFVLAWLRLAVHLYGPVPGIAPEPSRWVRLSAKLMHVALYVLMIGLHAAAALYHHYVVRDDTLRRMLPFPRR